MNGKRLGMKIFTICLVLVLLIMGCSDNYDNHEPVLNKYTPFTGEPIKTVNAKEVKKLIDPKKYILINPGEFSMGSPQNEMGRNIDEKQHLVRITKPFWISKFEITNEEWNVGTPPILRRGRRVFELKIEELQKICVGENFSSGQYSIVDYEKIVSRTITRATRKGNIITIESKSHGLSKGAFVTLAGISGHLENDPDPNDVHIVNGVTDDNFTIFQNHSGFFDITGSYNVGQKIKFKRNFGHTNQAKKGEIAIIESIVHNKNNDVHHPIFRLSDGTTLSSQPRISGFGRGVWWEVFHKPKENINYEISTAVQKTSSKTFFLEEAQKNSGSGNWEIKKANGKKYQINKKKFPGLYLIINHINKNFRVYKSGLLFQKNPVTHVSHSQAVAYCWKRTTEAHKKGLLPKGLIYRLPTEAEWEYACRAGTLGICGLGSGERLSGVNACLNGSRPEYVLGGEVMLINRKKVAAINIENPSYEPNAWGIHDMHGNVMEWCHDFYSAYSSNSKSVDPLGPFNGSRRVVRGGSFYRTAQECRSASRFSYEPSYRGSEIGFRMVIGYPLL